MTSNELRAKLPNCPKCQMDELWFWHVGYLFRLRCYGCGWDSDEIEQIGVLDDAIAKAVAFYTETR
jgi:Zn ribbon nucleic-acid-binding protein